MVTEERGVGGGQELERKGSREDGRREIGDSKPR